MSSDRDLPGVGCATEESLSDSILWGALAVCFENTSLSPKETLERKIFLSLPSSRTSTFSFGWRRSWLTFFIRVIEAAWLRCLM